MALRSLLVSAVVGIAALGAFHSPAAQAGGSISISVGTPHHGNGHYGSNGYYGGGGYGGGGYYGGNQYGGDYRGGYDRGQRAGYVWVPPHWVATRHGRVFVQGQYVRAQGHGYGHDPRYGSGYGQPVIYRQAIRPLPGGFYHQRGGYEYPTQYYPPRRGW